VLSFLSVLPSIVVFPLLVLSTVFQFLPLVLVFLSSFLFVKI
jgi:hypothetical protein